MATAFGKARSGVVGVFLVLALLAVSAFTVSDSGGIQEEITAFGVPAIVLRDSTERPEVLGSFAELIGGDDVADFHSARQRLEREHAERRRDLAAQGSPYASPDGRAPSAHVVDMALRGPAAGQPAG